MLSNGGVDTYIICPLSLGAFLCWTMEWDGKDGPIQLFLAQPSASLMIVELESGENQAILDFPSTLSPSCANVLCVRLFEKGYKPGSIISHFKDQPGACGPKVN